MLSSLRASALLLVASLITGTSSAHWSLNPTANNAVTTGAGWSSSTQIVPDDQGGAIIVWEEHRDGLYQTYAQRMGYHGDAMWAQNGIAVGPASADQYQPRIVRDGDSGAVIAWFDLREGTPAIYAQRLLSSGTRLWSDVGIPVTSSTQNLDHFSMCTDSQGGAVFTWTNYSGPFAPDDIYAQRVDAAGQLQWGSGGLPVCVQPGWQGYPVISPTNNGLNYMIAYGDSSSGEDQQDLYAQMISASGEVVFPGAGLPVCTAVGAQALPQIVPDGDSGGIVAWRDTREGGLNADIYAQRLNLSGTRLWAETGEAVTTATGHQLTFKMVPDKQGGAFLAWLDLRQGEDEDIYAQRINADGQAHWQINGLPVATGPALQAEVDILADEADGLYCAYQSKSGPEQDILMQRLAGDGTAIWADPAAICNAVGAQYTPRLAPAVYGGVIAAWEDSRSDPMGDIYCSYVNSAGTLGPVLAELDPTWSGWTDPVCPSNTARPCKMKVQLSVRNAGALDVGKFNVSFYLSTDDTLDGGDIQLKDWKVKKLKVGATATKKLKVKVPNSPASQTLRIIAVVDSTLAIQELSEANNTIVLKRLDP